MRNKMKNIRILSVLFLLSLFFVSCEEEQNNEWERYYGYTNEEIIGSYSNSNVADAFDGLTESLYCHVCDDARITVTAESENMVRFSVNSAEAALNTSLKGNPALNDDDFLITLVDSPYELTAYVYTNAKGQLRLHGFVRTDYPNLVNYYFDVIKN